MDWETGNQEVHVDTHVILYYISMMVQEVEGVELVYQAPAKPTGLVLIFHGCAHSAIDWWRQGDGCTQCLGRQVCWQGGSVLVHCNQVHIIQLHVEPTKRATSVLVLHSWTQNENTLGAAEGHSCVQHLSKQAWSASHLGTLPHVCHLHPMVPLIVLVKLSRQRCIV